MDCVLAPLFAIVECPRLKIKKPSFITWPSPMVFFSIIILSYFLVTGGVFLLLLGSHLLLQVLVKFLLRGSCYLQGI
ncbi:unnamed protein product [Schistosoma bovis]|nr:unnamed protein product [Schistosoma bovis]